jgi:hypothetical protein
MKLGKFLWQLLVMLWLVGCTQLPMSYEELAQDQDFREYVGNRSGLEQVSMHCEPFAIPLCLSEFKPDGVFSNQEKIFFANVVLVMQREPEVRRYFPREEANESLKENFGFSLLEVETKTHQWMEEVSRDTADPRAAKHAASILHLWRSEASSMGE